MSKAPFVFALTCFIIWNVQVNVFVLGVDECDAGLKSCPANSTCSDPDVNVNGTATCTCNAGFRGNETMCEVDVCETPGICGDNALCEHTPDGSFSCFCARGYTDINGTCVDKNDCTKISGICHVDADCFANGTSFECKCKNGYTGDGKDCADIDECEGQNECASNRTCFNSPGSYECGCKVTVDPTTTCKAAQDKIDNKVNDGSDDDDNDDDDDDNDTVIILLSITIVLLVLCLIALLVTTCCVYRMQKGY